MRMSGLNVLTEGQKNSRVGYGDALAGLAQPALLYGQQD